MVVWKLPTICGEVGRWHEPGFGHQSRNEEELCQVPIIAEKTAGGENKLAGAGQETKKVQREASVCQSVVTTPSLASADVFPCIYLFAANPPVLVPKTTRWSHCRFVGGLASHLLPGRFSVSAMPGNCRLIPRIAATGAIRDVSRSVEECSGKIAVAAALQVDHVIYVLTGVAVHEQPGTRGAPLLALLGIAREPLTRRRVADGKIEPVAEPDAERPECWPLGVR